MVHLVLGECGALLLPTEVMLRFNHILSIAIVWRKEPLCSRLTRIEFQLECRYAYEYFRIGASLYESNEHEVMRAISTE